MKTTRHAITLMLATAFLLAACTSEKEEGPMNGNKIFPTVEEAAAKAKSDLLLALEQNKNLDLGVNPARLRDARQGALIRFAVVDFERLLRADSVASLAELVAEEKSTVAPFTLGNEVITIVEIGKKGDGWQVATLANKSLTDDLNIVGAASSAAGTTTIYEIPNLQVLVYAQRDTAGERYHVQFDRFSLREGVDIRALFPVLRNQARNFQAQFGDRLKKEPLVR